MSAIQLAAKVVAPRNLRPCDGRSCRKNSGAAMAGTLPTAVDAACMTLDNDGLGLKYMMESLNPGMDVSNSVVRIKAFPIVNNMEILISYMNSLILGFLTINGRYGGIVGCK